MNLAATMSLNASGFTNPLAAVRKELGGALSSMKGLALAATGLGSMFAAFKGGEAIVESFFAAFEKGHELEKLSRMTGQSIGDLVGLQRAFKDAGMDAGDLGRQIIMLQRSLGGVNENGEPTRAIFEQLGLSVENLQKMSAPAAFEAIAEKLQKLPNAAQRTAAAMAIFGRSGAEMLAVLDDPNLLKEAMASSKELGDIYQRNAKIFAHIIVTFNSIKTKAAGFYAGVAEGVAPLLKSLLDTIKKIDLVGLGKSVGSYLRAATEAFRQGQLGELVSLSLKVGIGKAVNYLVASMKAAFMTMGNMVTVVVDNFTPIKDFLVAAAASFGAALLKALDKPFSYIQAFFEGIAPGGAMDIHSAAKTEASKQLRENDPRFKGLSESDINGPFGSVGMRITGNKAGLERQRQFIEARDALEDKIAKEMGATSLSERAKEIQKTGVVYGIGAETDTADQMIKQANAELAEKSKAMPAIFDAFTTALKKGLGSFKVEDIANAGADGKKLVALLARLSGKRSAAAGEDGDKQDGGLGLLGAGKHGAIDGDRLAKIGGFIGGSGGPALDFAKRTAVGVEKTAAAVLQLLKLPALNTSSANMGAYV